ncbi:uncharacterized protein V6R79_008335 [Siganus canaliculatus]
MKKLIEFMLILTVALTSTHGSEEVIYGQVGETVVLKPPQRPDRKDLYLYWFCDDTEVAWRNIQGRAEIEKFKDILHLHEDSLVIRNFTRERLGSTCYCQLKNGHTYLTKITYRLLNLNAGKSPSTPLLPKEELTLTCNAESLEGHKPEIHWLNPQGERVNDPSSIQGTHKLSAESRHNGEWVCVVKDKEKESKAKISVVVLGLSPEPSGPQYTSKSSPLTIPCSLLSHISWEQIKAKGIQEGTWHFSPKSGLSAISDEKQRLFSLSLEDPVTWKPDQNKGLTPADVKKGNLSLTKNRASEGDAGSYVCALKFKSGLILNSTVRVEMLQITSSPETELISGQQLNLTCSIGSPLPSHLQVKWFPPEKTSLPPLPPHGPHPAHLSIQEMSLGDGGKWRCELWQSDTKLTSAEIVLKIEPRLSTWMLVIICSVTAIIFLLIILAFIIRRRRQKMRHLRHRLCQCKNPKPKGFYRS